MEDFSQVYDKFMAHVPYDKWVLYLESLFIKHTNKPTLIAELGCGTGNITSRLAKKYEMIGIDKSCEMLSIARQKKQSQNILYLNQDMCELELYGTVDCFISLFDTLNYLEDTAALTQVFKNVFTYLNPDGLFIFDMNTPYKFESVMADNVFSGENATSAYVCKNTYDAKLSQNTYNINFFDRQPNGLYKRYSETNYETCFTMEEVKTCLTDAQLEIIEVYNAYTLNPPHQKSERIFFVAKKRSL